MTETLRTDTSRLAGFVKRHALLGRIRAAASPERVYLVGGAVRDGLVGNLPVDLDLVMESNPAALALELDPQAVVHDRFGTAEAVVEGTRVDLARAREERYPVPGALPEVGPAGLVTDLVRRDFTINAMGVPLDHPETLIDPHGGQNDLDRGVLRVLHKDSFRDDPTRALRAARYAARFGFDLAPSTTDLLPDVDLSSVSTERVEAELELIAGEDTALEALRLANRWGLLEVPEEKIELARRAQELGSDPDWSGLASRSALILAAIDFNADEVLARLGEKPDSPSQGVAAAGGFNGAELLLARAAGLDWLDRYRREWSKVELEITGADLLAAGLPQGPAVGNALDAAMKAKLDHGISGVEAELEVGLDAARSDGSGGGSDAVA